MNPKVWLLLARAREDVEFAEDILHTANAWRAAHDAYYAMFHAAEALLLSLGITTSSHGETHGAFGQHFAKTRVLDPKFHRYLIDAFNARITADYDATVTLPKEDAEVLVAQAREFVAATERYLSAHETRQTTYRSAICHHRDALRRDAPT